MEVKRLSLASALAILSLQMMMGCQQPTKQEAVIVDDQNSEFVGKTCYGQSLKHQYILTWSDGSVSLFRGSKTQLSHHLAEASLLKKQVVMAEQDRQLSLKPLTHLSSPINPLNEDNKGIFWQVWGQEDVQVQTLWDANIKGDGVSVAVIDTGVDLNHPSLKGRIAVNSLEVPENGLDDDGNGLIDDANGYDFAYKAPRARPADHGTHVAGIIAAEPSSSPMVGMAPGAKILPLNIMDDRGGGSLSAAVFAIQYAKEQGAKVINASWGGAICAETLKKMIASLAEQEVLFVAAAGNDGVDIDIFPEYPAGFGLANQITIGASMPSGLMAAFSNYSPNRVHVLAPGHQILSSVPGGWMPASGTSMAAPFVSGLAALLWSKYPEATLQQIKKAIISSVKTPQNYTPVQSGGRINAPQALQKLEILLEHSTDAR